IITSPTFDGDSNGVVTVKLTSRQYNNDVASAKVELLDKNQNVLDEVSVPVDDKFREYAVKLNGKADAAMFVRISNEANKKRIFVSKVDIYNGDATEEEDTRDGKLDSRMITGIEGTSYTLTDLKPGVIYDYRIKAIPRDVNSFNESAWSEKKELDLGNISGINEIMTESMPVEYFTLQGLKISKPTVSGIYIRKSGKKTQKVIIK
ncbi:MAG: fibronectin type III domain-containing protein, partial [Muribaculaceae bacterium]|nr:fibronectin type III domain-containing protein [Muribaculaceae bacterium]